MIRNSAKPIIATSMLLSILYFSPVLAEGATSSLGATTEGAGFDTSASPPSSGADSSPASMLAPPTDQNASPHGPDLTDDNRRNGSESTPPEPLGNPAINNDTQTFDPATTAEEFVELEFSDLDADGDGVFTVEENGERGVFLEAQFNSLDTNHDGGIDQFEFSDFKQRKESALD